MEVNKNYSDNRFDKYNSLTDELSQMIDSKGKGYNVAQHMNDEFWENLGTHRGRMLEQIGKMKNSASEDQFQQELTIADNIYEATRSYLAKY